VPDRVRHCLEQIEAQAQWISKIIQDMLAEADGEPRPEPADIARLVREAVNSEQLTHAQPISLHQPDQEPRYVMATATRLRRALANVLANATHAAGPHGHVQLTERVNGNTELIEISDDGPGFGSTAADGRAGIGLRITQEILAECGGRIEVGRLSSGQTLVRLLLPISTEGGQAGEADEDRARRRPATVHRRHGRGAHRERGDGDRGGHLPSGGAGGDRPAPA
jgi:signal transduction histidine kinase